MGKRAQQLNYREYKMKDVIEIEVFKPVPGTNGKYQVTNLGRILSLNSDKFLKFQSDKDGYQIASFKVNDVFKTMKVHRIVAAEFCEGYKEGLEVNHLDAIRENNRATNLEWATRLENMKHAWESYSKGGKRALSPYRKKYIARVAKVKELDRQGICVQEIASMLKFTRSKVYYYLKKC